MTQEYLDFMAILDWDYSEVEIQGDLFADDEQDDS